LPPRHLGWLTVAWGRVGNARRNRAWELPPGAFRVATHKRHITLDSTIANPQTGRHSIPSTEAYDTVLRLFGSLRFFDSLAGIHPEFSSFLLPGVLSLRIPGIFACFSSRPPVCGYVLFCICVFGQGSFSGRAIVEVKERKRWD
jgi:hypothetical protein